MNNQVNFITYIIHGVRIICIISKEQYNLDEITGKHAKWREIYERSSRQSKVFASSGQIKLSSATHFPQRVVGVAGRLVDLGAVKNVFCLCETVTASGGVLQFLLSYFLYLKLNAICFLVCLLLSVVVISKCNNRTKYIKMYLLLSLYFNSLWKQFLC